MVIVHPFTVPFRYIIRQREKVSPAQVFATSVEGYLRPTLGLIGFDPKLSRRWPLPKTLQMFGSWVVGVDTQAHECR